MKTINVVILISLLLSLLACQSEKQTNSPVELPIIGPARSFSFIDSNNQVFSSEQLSNQVWLVNFFFTSCPAICPVVMGEVSKVHQAFSDNSQIRLVSISVDPKRDSTAVLAEYSKKFSANTDTWHFLHGEKDVVQDLISTGFKLVAGDEPDAHSTRLVLVDKNYQIRAYFDGLEPGVSAKINSAIKKLLTQ